MKIFITGITGLLGRHVAQLCFKEGHEIFALIRDKKIDKSSFPFDLNICHGDITDLDFLVKNLNDPEIIIHCAADTNLISVKNQKQEDTNINGLKNLIIASKKANIKKFIHISSASTIKFGDALNPADESIRLAKARFRLPYINTKIIGEEILLNEFNTNHFPVIILNPTFILGPNDFNRSSDKLLFSAINKQIPLYPWGGKNIVDVRDVAKVVLNSFYRGALGNNYLLCNENLTYREIFSLSCAYARVTAPKYKMPFFIGIFLGLLGSCYELITKRSFSINIKTIKISTQNHYYKADKARKELAFSTRPVNETIKDTVNCFQQGCLT